MLIEMTYNTVALAGGHCNPKAWDLLMLVYTGTHF